METTGSACSASRFGNRATGCARSNSRHWPPRETSCARLPDLCELCVGRPSRRVGTADEDAHCSQRHQVAGRTVLATGSGLQWAEPLCRGQQASSQGTGRNRGGYGLCLLSEGQQSLQMHLSAHDRDVRILYINCWVSGVRHVRSGGVLYELCHERKSEISSDGQVARRKQE